MGLKETFHRFINRGQESKRKTIQDEIRHRSWEDARKIFMSTGGLVLMAGVFNRATEIAHYDAQVWETTDKYSSDNYSMILYWDSATREFGGIPQPSAKGVKITADLNGGVLVQMTGNHAWEMVPSKIGARSNAEDKFKEDVRVKFLFAFSSADHSPVLDPATDRSGHYRKIFPAA